MDAIAHAINNLAEAVFFGLIIAAFIHGVLSK